MLTDLFSCLWRIQLPTIILNLKIFIKSQYTLVKCKYIILPKPGSELQCRITQIRKLNVRSNLIQKAKQGFIIKDNINSRNIKLITIIKASQ